MSSLSIYKLEKLLKDKKIDITRMFVTEDLCDWIQVSSYENNFLIYIPSKYSIAPIKGKNNKLKHIEYIELDREGAEQVQVREFYKGGIHIDTISDDIKGQLEKGYDYDIKIDNIPTEDTAVLIDNEKQLNRLGLSVKNLKYKLCICFKNYISVIRRDDSVEHILIKDGGRDTWVNGKKLMVLTDLELLYTTLDNVTRDVNTIRKGIYDILESNKQSHGVLMARFIEQQSTNFENASRVIETHNDSLTKIRRYEVLLEQITQPEMEMESTIEQLRSTRTGGDNYSTDLDRSRNINVLEKKLDKIRTIKKEICGQIDKIRIGYEDMILTMDNIMFDNQIMLDNLNKNFNALKYLI